MMENKISRLVLMLIIPLALISCKKDNETANQTKILDKWVSVDKSDTIEFTDEHNLYKSSLTMRHEHYNYTMYDDSIEIGYEGSLYILIFPTKHKYSFNGNNLTIDFSNGCYGFDKRSITYTKDN